MNWLCLRAGQRCCKAVIVLGVGVADAEGEVGVLVLSFSRNRVGEKLIVGRLFPTTRPWGWDSTCWEGTVRGEVVVGIC